MVWIICLWTGTCCVLHVCSLLHFANFVCLLASCAILRGWFWFAFFMWQVWYQIQTTVPEKRGAPAGTCFLLWRAALTLSAHRYVRFMTKMVPSVWRIFSSPVPWTGWTSLNPSACAGSLSLCAGSRSHSLCQKNEVWVQVDVLEFQKTCGRCWFAAIIWCNFNMAV